MVGDRSVLAANWRLDRPAIVRGAVAAFLLASLLACAVFVALRGAVEW